jgi:hypothetical protein
LWVVVGIASVILISVSAWQAHKAGRLPGQTAQAAGVVPAPAPGGPGVAGGKADGPAPAGELDNPMAGPRVGDGVGDGRAVVVNASCPVMPRKVISGPVRADLRRQFHGVQVGFCCEDCAESWDGLSDAEREGKLQKVLRQGEKLPAAGMGNQDGRCDKITNQHRYQ